MHVNTETRLRFMPTDATWEPVRGFACSVNVVRDGQVIGWIDVCDINPTCNTVRDLRNATTTIGRIGGRDVLMPREGFEYSGYDH